MQKTKGKEAAKTAKEKRQLTHKGAYAHQYQKVILRLIHKKSKKFKSPKLILANQIQQHTDYGSSNVYAHHM